LKLLSQRVQILLEAIAAVKQDTLIDPRRIGIWGISQGGYVMSDAPGVFCSTLP